MGTGRQTSAPDWLSLDRSQASLFGHRMRSVEGAPRAAPASQPSQENQLTSHAPNPRYPIGCRRVARPCVNEHRRENARSDAALPLAGGFALALRDWVLVGGRRRVVFLLSHWTASVPQRAALLDWHQSVRAGLDIVRAQPAHVDLDARGAGHAASSSPPLP